jgi:pimeloyl-ACP methyl ester carboxylesterase
MRAFRVVVLAEVVVLITLACIGFVYESRSRVRDRELYSPPGQLIDVGGHRLHIQCLGQGSPTVVFDAGLVGSSLDWHRVLPSLASKTRVCAYDRGGYGWSDPSRRPRTLEGITEDLHTLLRNSGQRPPYVLVGHSLGGLNMWAYAANFPGEVAGLVLVDSAHPEEPIPFPLRERLFLRFEQLTLPFGLPRWRGWCGGKPEEIREQKTAVSCRPEFIASHYEQWNAIPEFMAGARKLPRLGAVPLVIISRDTSREVSERWHAWQKDLTGISSAGKLVIAEGSGHGIPGGRPDVIVREITNLLKELRVKK